MSELLNALTEAEKKAWDSLSRYKFQMFGYWASIWVHLNKIGKFKKHNPFKKIVKIAKGNNEMNKEIFDRWFNSFRAFYNGYTNVRLSNNRKMYHANSIARIIYNTGQAVRRHQDRK